MLLTRADLKRAWIDLWGGNHVRSPVGVSTVGTSPPVRFLVEKLKPLELAPGDLMLDPNFPAGRKPIDVGADLSRMGIAPPPKSQAPR
jgi:hypothetical protein